MDDTSAPNGAFPREDLYRAVYPGVEVRDTPAGTGMPTLHGHFAVFNAFTEIASAWEGTFMERISPGAFSKTFQENRDRMRVLFQHGHDPQIGDKPLGPIANLREDSTGAYYEVPLLDTGYTREILPGLQAGLYGASFRFQVMKEEVVDEPKPSAQNPRGLPERTITEAKVLEFGPVTFPAYEGATAGVRSLTDKFRPERVEVHTSIEVDGHAIADAVTENLDALAEEPAEATPDASREALDTDQADSRHLAQPSRTEAKRSTTGLDLYPKREEAPSWRL